MLCSRASALRPVRMLDWLKKLLSLVPGDLLTEFLEICLSVGPEEAIRLFEVNRGEAESNSYYGEPKGINLSSLIKVNPLIQNNSHVHS